MFGMGMPEVLLILAIALIVLGPKKLPEIAKALGRSIAEFKKATQEFRENLEVDNELKGTKEVIQEVKGDIQQAVQGAASTGNHTSSHNKAPEDGPENTLDEALEEAQQKPGPYDLPQEAVPKEPSTDA